MMTTLTTTPMAAARADSTASIPPSGDVLDLRADQRTGLTLIPATVIADVVVTNVAGSYSLRARMASTAPIATVHDVASGILADNDTGILIQTPTPQA